MFAPLHSTWAKATCRILILGGTYFREVASRSMVQIHYRDLRIIGDDGHMGNLRLDNKLTFCSSPQPRRAARWTLYGSGSTDRGGTISPSLPSSGEFNFLFQCHSSPFYIVFVDLWQRYNAKNKQRLRFGTHWHPSDNQNAGTKDQMCKHHISLISDGDQTRWSVVPQKVLFLSPFVHTFSHCCSTLYQITHYIIHCWWEHTLEN